MLFFVVVGFAQNDPPSSNKKEKDEKKRNGPNGTFTYDIISKIGSPDHDFTEYKLLSVANTLYQDDNPKSGYFYYYPAQYSLNWVEARQRDQYDLNVNFGTDNRVTLTAILKPKLSIKDIRIAETLLKGSVPNDVEVKELAVIPMSRTPEINFSNLGQFGVDEASISIRAPSDLTEPVQISFTTTRIDDLMNMFFNDIGLYGDVVIFPNGVGMPESIRIPFNLKIDDPRTYGRFELLGTNWRSKEDRWENKTDYPVILSSLHVLREERNGKFQIYTWGLGDTEVPENSSANFLNINSVPTWLDRDPSVKRMWMDYTVKPCRSCDRKIRDDINEGVEGKSRETIEITILYPIEFTGAELIKLKVRSFQADPNNKEKVDLETLSIRQDGGDYQVGPLYVPIGDKPEFEYQIQVIMPDGTIHKSYQWKKVDGVDLAVGESQIKEQIPHFN